MDGGVDQMAGLTLDDELVTVMDARGDHRDGEGVGFVETTDRLAVARQHQRVGGAVHQRFHRVVHPRYVDVLDPIRQRHVGRYHVAHQDHAHLTTEALAQRPKDVQHLRDAFVGPTTGNGEDGEGTGWRDVHVLAGIGQTNDRELRPQLRPHVRSGVLRESAREEEHVATAVGGNCLVDARHGAQTARPIRDIAAHRQHVLDLDDERLAEEARRAGEPMGHLGDRIGHIRQRGMRLVRLPARVPSMQRGRQIDTRTVGNAVRGQRHVVRHRQRRNPTLARTRAARLTQPSFRVSASSRRAATARRLSNIARSVKETRRTASPR